MENELAKKMMDNMDVVNGVATVGDSVFFDMVPADITPEVLQIVDDAREEYAIAATYACALAHDGGDTMHLTGGCGGNATIDVQLNALNDEVRTFTSVTHGFSDTGNDAMDEARKWVNENVTLEEV